MPLLPDQSAPGVQQLAEAVADSVCRLADAAGHWSLSAVEDAVEAIDTLVAAVSQIDPDVARALAGVPAATAAALRRFGAEPEEQPDTMPLPVPLQARRVPRRRGLGHGYQGIRIPEEHPTGPRLAPT
ncbi:hypothetical protein ACFCYC_15305 [Streptomyces sp. NPDC056402]|uniref:hypothetical protein n=1 Tax=Streptomyces sp. NPDC056402 TaxID=3345810 RepID=UPI0035D687E9